MKKSTFVIAETMLSVVLIAAVASVAALAVDIKTGGSIIPPELYGGKSQSSVQSKDKEDDNKESSETKQESKENKKEESSSSQTSKQETSKQETSKQETSKTETSKSETSEKQPDNKTQNDTSGLILEQPENLKDQPKELTKFINDFGYDYENLGTYLDHLIVVDSDSNSGAKVYCYQRGDNDIWWNIAGEGKPVTEKGFVGEKGPDFDIKPDSKKSPLGFYSLGEGFYIGEKPDSTYPMFEITENTYWVNDPKSAFYNTKVEGTDKKDWSKADHMISSKDSYQYGIVVNYNTYNIDSKLAGGIFLCCGNAPTEGSIVVPKDTMKAILEWLDEDSTANIYIMT